MTGDEKKGPEMKISSPPFSQGKENNKKEMNVCS